MDEEQIRPGQEFRESLYESRERQRDQALDELIREREMEPIDEDRATNYSSDC